MEPSDFKEYLEKRYYNQLAYYEDASEKNQKRYKYFQWVLIILSTLTTILAALPKNEKFDIQLIVVISAASVTILTAGLKTFQYQELWVNYRSTIEQLKPEIYYYNFNVGDYGLAGVDKESTFVWRVEQILSKERDGWPAIKKLQDQTNQKIQANDELQRKLDELLREKFNTQKNTQRNVPADINPPPGLIDTNKPGDDTQDQESSKANQIENNDPTITDDANTENKVTEATDVGINNNQNKRDDKTDQ